MSQQNPQPVAGISTSGTSCDKKAFIKTFGCQMNERDSEIIGQLVCEASYSPAPTMEDADLVVLNTCSIREKAEQKVMSLLGRLRLIKKTRPSMIIAVAGCVAQQEQKALLSRMGHIDIVLGTRSIHLLPEMIQKVAAGQGPQLSVSLDENKIPSFLPAHTLLLERSLSEFKRFITIMQGCDNYCAYCVVPHTRGRETSRPLTEILSEVTMLAAQGVTDITLLGQNVNSYGKNLNQQIDFPNLLKRIASIKGIERLRFTTSHPKDLSPALMECFATIDTLCPHFHLPVQSGSNRILQKMNRKYTVENYLEKVRGLRAVCPDIVFTTDIILGFPGEGDEDFAATMELLETVRFHDAFSFKYSDRPNVRSVSFSDKVPEEVKSARLSRLQQRQKIVSLEQNRFFEGKMMEIMVEGPSKNEDREYCGRTTTNHVVNFTPSGNEPTLVGDMLTVRITEARVHSLRGEPV